MPGSQLGMEFHVSYELLRYKLFILRNALHQGLSTKVFCTKCSLLHGEVSELAEGARLEIVCAGSTGTEGSNPSLSAMLRRQGRPDGSGAANPVRPEREQR